MSLLDRMSTLLKADAHGVVDALEDRALLLRQHLRDAGFELEKKRARLEAFDTEDKDLEAERRAIGEESSKLEDDISLALSGGEEDLARFSIKKVLPLRRRTAVIDRRREDLRAERAELASIVERQEAEWTELQARARAYLARSERPEGVPGSDFESAWWAPVAEEEVELELLRRRREAAPETGGEKGGR